ncbi:hypothetical protein HYW20_05800 [Candidatus Woesearchaeota archaeon]|nr:hypothetical protein [Candidatus Woesearchaeota archaeon]
MGLMANLHVEELTSWDLPLNAKNLHDILAFVNKYQEAELKVVLPPGIGVFMSETHYNELEETLMRDKKPDYTAEPRRSHGQGHKKIPGQSFSYWKVDSLSEVVSAVAASQKDVRRIQNKNKLIGVAMSYGVYDSLREANLVKA